MGEPFFFLKNPFPSITWGQTHIKARSSWKDSVRPLVRLAVMHKQTIYQDGGGMLPTADPNETLLGWFISRWWTPDSHAGKCQKKKEKVRFSYQSLSDWYGLAEIQPQLCFGIGTPGTFGPTSGYEALANRLLQGSVSGWSSRRVHSSATATFKALDGILHLRSEQETSKHVVFPPTVWISSYRSCCCTGVPTAA